ncbi:alkaline dihydroceramidase SCDLUD_002036 [Saccharomycodes ludwigii]|uniref:alkaline dihydroceramidase n=1 Tax=Saccharomycodes ludwigii TaxID=36035 RepID=UPI001E8B61F7|nr:hypothetical protein SCDLUD_002036 [Saccharomycodes ludwigii]KAH3902220.1 hypothetical protein SCDLUD_002036 [Saccharomycodes ludwigii]
MNAKAFLWGIIDFFRIKEYPEASTLENADNIWGPVTSTIDWCEENYVISPYLAEFSNTITNLFYCFLATYITLRAYQYHLEGRFILIGLGFGLVGIGSWLFHMTLKYEYQLLDELPMIYATCVPAWSILTEPILWSRFSNIGIKKDVIVGFIITSSAVLVTYTYLFYKNPIIHQICYGALNLTIIVCASVYTFKYIKDPVILINLKKCVIIGVSSFLLGFFFWNLDVQFCSAWIYIRRSYLLLPMGALLEMHAWWHLLTGVGIYYSVIYLEYLRIAMHHQDDEYILIWKHTVFPEVVLREKILDYWGGKISLTFRGPIVHDIEEVRVFEKRLD